MRWIYLGLALAYLISPYDLLPDFMGLPGRLDDVAVLIFVYIKYFYRFERRVKQTATGPTKPTTPAAIVADPYEVLELQRGATAEEIDGNYRLLMSKYHPDKVDHLGDDLKKLAHKKSLQIQEAYGKLKRTGS